MTTASAPTVLDHYLALGEAGAFEAMPGKVELVGGRIVVVNKGRWHAAVEGKLMLRLGPVLEAAGFRTEIAPTVPLSDSDAPDPDLVWTRADAEPLAGIGTGRIKAFDPADYGLVVEVADTTLRIDAGEKAVVLARAGVAHYWVVHRGGVIVFADPTPDGYRSRVEYTPSDAVPIPHTDAALDLGQAFDVPAWAD